MNREQFINDFWAFYLILESKFLDTSQYVELDADNFSTFSKEYIFLLESIGAELDNVFKLYCGFGFDEYKNISDYANVILDEESELSYCSIVDEIIRVFNTQIHLKPFEGWLKDKPKQSLTWWEAYDNIKHGRHINKKEANLENVANALSALYLLEMKYLQSIIEEGESGFPDQNSNLFLVKGWTIHTNGNLRVGFNINT